MNILDKAIEKAIHTDALREAEKITGLSYKEDDLTQSLGFLISQKNAEEKDALLELAGDTKFHNELGRYLAICLQLDFKLVLEISYVCKLFKEPRNEKQFLLYRKPGVLLVFDTYHQESVNGSTLYYNWVPNGGMKGCYERQREEHVYVTSSGCWNKEDGES